MHAPPATDPVNFFEAGSPFLNHPLLTAERTSAEVDHLEQVLDLTAGASVLDVGCGFGRHSIELSRRGYAATGIDPSATMIGSAVSEAAAAGVDARFMQLAGEELAVEGFDAALCLFTTLGQIGPGGGTTDLLARIRSALRPGARVAVEVPQAGAAIDALTPHEKFGNGEHRTVVTRTYDDSSVTVTERFRVIAGPAETSYVLRYRLFTAEELTSALVRTGFNSVRLTAGYSDEPLVPDSQTMLAVARAG